MELIRPDTNIDFLGKRKIAAVVSAVVVAGSIAATSLEFNIGIDFAGGTEVQVRFSQPVSTEAIRAALADLDLGDVQVKSFGQEEAEWDYLIRVEARDVEEPSAGGEATDRPPSQALVSNSILDRLAKEFNEDPASLKQRIGFVGPRAGVELRNKGSLAILITLGGILLYIAFRFEAIYGVGAVLALFHDVLITLGAFLITGREFNLTTIAAILTIVGYSLNDTIVVFDRIRENTDRFKGKAFPEIVNRSLNDTLARTLLTSLTTLLVVGALFVWGGGQVHDFAFALLVGIIVGTYSSIFVASSFIVYWRGRTEPAPRRSRARAAT